MRHKPLGRTGLFVPELCLGTMTFGGGAGIWGQIGDLQQADAERLIGQSIDAGINFSLMVWRPLAGGLLSGKVGRDQQPQAGNRRSSFDFPPVQRERAFDCIDAMRPVAQRKGVSVAQVALAWLLQQLQVTRVIIGARRPDQLADNLAATQLRLDADELRALDAASRLPAESPGWMFERQGEIRRWQLREAQGG